MRYLDEYRDRTAALAYREQIHDVVTRPWTLMEVCGGQTHTIVRYGIDQLLPDCVELIHGPGCPVCVTPAEDIDRAVSIAGAPGVIFCSFGDMLRVPGHGQDLLSAKSQGGDVRIVYSPMDALAIARAHPAREVVFFAIGFETTAPANAMAVFQAKREELSNFSVLVSHVLVPPAMETILSSPSNRVQGFLAAGHVCTIMGTSEYAPIVERFRVPVVVTGFEPLDLLQGIHLCLKQLEEGRAEVENQYTRSVRPGGNPSARAMIAEVFEVVDQKWRGIGSIEQSGLRLRQPYREFDAGKRFQVPAVDAQETACISGEILLGVKKPAQCSAFGNSCTPEQPLGAPMVSSEGACAAYYRYRREAP